MKAIAPYGDIIAAVLALIAWFLSNTYVEQVKAAKSSVESAEADRRQQVRMQPVLSQLNMIYRSALRSERSSDRASRQGEPRSGSTAQITAGNALTQLHVEGSFDSFLSVSQQNAEDLLAYANVVDPGADLMSRINLAVKAQRASATEYFDRKRKLSDDIASLTGGKVWQVDDATADKVTELVNKWRAYQNEAGATWAKDSNAVSAAFSELVRIGQQRLSEAKGRSNVANRWALLIAGLGLIVGLASKAYEVRTKELDKTALLGVEGKASGTN